MNDKRIILGVCGSIAAYKAAALARALVSARAQVTTIMTPSATRFIGPLTFETITGRPVVTSLFEGAGAGSIEHITLTKAADLVLVAPATANILAKAAHGVADDALSTTLAAATCPVLLAPAMNDKMYLSEATQANIAALRDRGWAVMEAGTGELACGDAAPGRLPEVESIVEEAEALLERGSELAGVKVVVTAGGTREPIDPVRFVGNRSSGRMGYALAAAAAARAGDVVLVSAPSALAPPAGVRVVRVETADEMLQAVLSEMPAGVLLMAAAVADYRPLEPRAQKVKKDEAPQTLVLEPTVDILARVGVLEGRPLTVGFAAETEELEVNSAAKLAAKRLDMIVANPVGGAGVGFDSPTNQALLLSADGTREELPLMAKSKMAAIIVDRVVSMLAAGSARPSGVPSAERTAT